MSTLATQLDGVEVVSSDGATASLSFHPVARADAPVVLCLPAMGIEARYYAGFARELQRLGLHAAILELRGLGTSSVRPSRHTDYGFGTMLERDLPPAIAELRERFPASALFLLGHSLGGQLATLQVALQPEGIAGLVLVASGTPFHRNWPFPLGLVPLSMGVLFPAVAAALGYFPGQHLSFAGKESRGVISEWAHIVRTGRFQLRGWKGREPEEALAQVRLPIFGVSLHHDRFTPQPVLRHLLTKMPQARVETFHYDYREHGQQPVDHNRWPRHPEVIAERVAAWVLSQEKEEGPRP